MEVGIIFNYIKAIAKIVLFVLLEMPKGIHHQCFEIV